MDEIDNIFSEVKKKKTIVVAATSSGKASSGNKKKKIASHKSVKVQDDHTANYGIIKSNKKIKVIISPEAPLERIDSTSGLPVYKAHLLKVGDGGG